MVPHDVATSQTIDEHQHEVGIYHAVEAPPKVGSYVVSIVEMQLHPYIEPTPVRRDMGDVDSCSPIGRVSVEYELELPRGHESIEKLGRVGSASWRTKMTCWVDGDYSELVTSYLP